MTKPAIRALLATILPAETNRLDTPTAEDWQKLEVSLGARFPSDFVSFIELMSEFSFPGDIYNPTQSGRTNGNDTIELVYAHELQFGGWPAELIPCYGIGNGDYFALNRDEGIASAVYYRHHGDGRVDKYSDSFESWIRNYLKSWPSRSRVATST